jgi:GT2 family glycosyltransferase
MRRHQAGRRVGHVVVDHQGSAARWPDEVEAVLVDPELGWASARNAGLRRTAGSIALVADGSVEADGDAIGPLLEAFQDPSVGIAGAFGLVSDDLRTFREADGPDVDAIEAYLLAVRRDLLTQGIGFDEHFRFYRHADLDLSFRVKAMGLRAVVVPVPVTRHVHRMWEVTPPEERDRLSKRNFYRFLDRWRSRADLLERNRRE